MKTEYELLDSGLERKLERFGPYIFSRPAIGAVWNPTLSKEEWRRNDAIFFRHPENRWETFRDLPKSWNMILKDISFQISPTDFGHMGVFPEHSYFWPWIQEKIKAAKRPVRVLNLFAYSGGATIAAAKAGCSVCHVDASKGMVTYARENARLNGLQDAPIRWIVDDVHKFLTREIRREQFYDAIILDPPSFGRGSRGEVFKIERDIINILLLCKKLLTENPLFLLLTCHTPGLTPLTLKNIVFQNLPMSNAHVESGEMTLTPKKGYNVPAGSYATWQLL